LPASAKAKETGVSVKKVKPIIDLVRGKRVDEALAILKFLSSPVAVTVSRLVQSASANAENELLTRQSDLRIMEIYANQSTTVKRFRARSRGRASRINRRSSHITVVVDEERQVGE
jgi:large subunit ribosomal protein L22